MTSWASLLFWFAVALLGWTYAGYPLCIWAWARAAGRPLRRDVIKARVSILLVARNEAANVERKIENLFALDYPPELLEIVLASDASTDATVALARSAGGNRITVVEFDRHRGKPAVLNELVPALHGEIVVLMDMRQLLQPDALQQLVNNFADQAVGAVSGELHLLSRGSANGAVDGVGFYWRYEKFIRRQESRCDSTVGVTGALYALRRQLFETIPDDTLLDDVLIPMQIVRKGYRVLFEPLARMFDRVSASPAQEYRRKTRTIAGNFQLLCHHGWLLNPFANRLWLQTVSHKLCRLLSPALLLVVLAANIALVAAPVYQLLLLLQVLFYAAALAGQVSPALASRHSWCSVPHAFCLLNWSTVVGGIRFVRGSQHVTWQQATC